MKIDKIIKPAIFTGILILIFCVVGTLILKYDREGEMNMPFNLSKIIIISSAEGIDKQDENVWNFELIQNNDIYIEISKNEKYKDTDAILEITLDNFSIKEKPVKGEIVMYRPVQDTGKIYNYSKETEITDNITYIGSQQTDMKNLEISNQGGRMLFRISVKDLGNFISNEQKEIVHDGTILKNANVKTEEIKTKVTFDMTIKLASEKSFKSTIEIEVPSGDVVEKGTTSYEKTDFKDVVFKRI